MCLIALAWQAHPRYVLVLAGNRDEFRARPSAQVAFWHDFPAILAGRDLAAGGTWMGITRAGRFCALTNIRDRAMMRPAPQSRGQIVLDYLKGKPSKDKSAFAGYNLLYGDLKENRLFFDGNRPAQTARALVPGVYGLSNGGLNDPWPKTVLAQHDLTQALAQGKQMSAEEMTQVLLGALSRRERFDADLPDTGIGEERERALSPIFIDLPEYGSRASSVLLVEHDGTVHFSERNNDLSPPVLTRYRFKLDDRLEAFS